MHEMGLGQYEIGLKMRISGGGVALWRDGRCKRTEGMRQGGARQDLRVCETGLGLRGGIGGIDEKWLGSRDRMGDG